MLSDFGWLVLVWFIWMVIFFVTTYLIRFAMRGQQEYSQAQEDAITAAQHGQASDSAPPVAAGGSGGTSAEAPRAPQRPSTRPPQPLGPPVSAT